MAEARTDREQQKDRGRESSSSQSQSSQSQERGRESSSSQSQKLLSPGQRSEIRRRSSFDYGSSPFDLMRRLTEQMFGPLAPSVLRGIDESWSPQIEVFERDGKLVVRADLPGMKKDDVRVEVRDNTLILEGERREERKEDREGYFVTERSYGRFYRTIPLPDGVNGDNAKATFKDGVLELTMDAPKRQSPTKKIQIEESRS